MNAPIFKDTVRLCFLSMLGCILFSCSPDPGEELYVPHAEVVTDLQSEVFELINAHRDSLGLNPLTNLDLAYLKAEEHTEYMIASGKVSHDFFYDREAYLVAHADAEQVAENVAFAFSTAKGVVKAWLESPSHKSIIEGDFSHASICAMKGSDGSYFYTHLFIKK
ncbi:CAP domain-containing protein [Robertkochia flava]|uniref:CAP domain-containing protein n=1 Tax=Robertkochia flava TaxID=3447986 RepID=UPI001CCD483B|nr:CAP domain-containing protein [Robertkochia marina]